MTFDPLRSFSGMLDRSRMALCLVMFTVFIVNPFGFLIGQGGSVGGARGGVSDYETAHEGRALNSGWLQLIAGRCLWLSFHVR